MTTRTAPVAGIPAAPPLPAELDLLLRRLRLPHIRRHAPEVIATAKAALHNPGCSWGVGVIGESFCR